MYGNGKSERLIEKAMRGIKRDEYLLVSKVYPHNAGKPNIFASCDASLKRLGTDYLDLYLLHWRGSVPLAETVECMEALVRAGKIRRWGVSNFDVADMEELWSLPGGKNCAVNQVLYHIGSRGIEYDLIPWLSERGVAVMAYCPLAQGGTLQRMKKEILTDGTLLSIAEKYGITVMQLMLAFTLRKTNLTTIPKAGTPEHVEENTVALEASISEEDWDKVDKVFWPPTSKMHLDME
jgi:diketogulonate reductase-like aldo/keto reductase